MIPITAALRTAAGGAQAQATRHAATADNVANATTDGHHALETAFTSLVGQRLDAMRGSGSGSVIGAGVAASMRVGTSQPGPAVATTTATDLATRGDSFLPVQLSDGSLGLSRAGSFRADDQGVLRNTAGFALLGQAAGADGTLSLSGNVQDLSPVVIESGAHSVQISADGQVSAIGADGTRRSLYQIPAVTVTGVEGLEAVSGTAYRATGASGSPLLAVPGQGSSGTLLGGALQASAVSLDQEMSTSIATGHAYKANLRALATARDMTDALLDLKT